MIVQKIKLLKGKIHGNKCQCCSSAFSIFFRQKYQEGAFSKHKRVTLEIKKKNMRARVGNNAQNSECVAKPGNS